MRIIIDIAHPAHIHYFRNFAQIMEKRGHQYLMTIRDKGPIIDLAEYYNLKYQIRSSANMETTSKLNYAINSTKKIYEIAIKFKPNFFIDMGTIFASPVAKLLGASHIAFDDTEAGQKARLLLLPFTNALLTPKCFKKDIGKKHIKFNGYMELFYLHKNHFKPDYKVFDELNISNNKKTCVLRFVSWKAYHDKGQRGFSENEKIEIVKEISKQARVFISSESDSITDDLKPYLIKIHPGKMLDLLAFSDIYVGEGATMASECAMLGTPAIYFNSISAGTIDEQAKFGLVFHCNSYKEVLEKTIYLLSKVNLKEEWEIKRQKMLSNKIDMTAFLVWFVENFPQSFTVMKENPDFQNSFK